MRLFTLNLIGVDIEYRIKIDIDIESSAILQIFHTNTLVTKTLKHYMSKLNNLVMGYYSWSSLVLTFFHIYNVYLLKVIGHLSVIISVLSSDM